MRSHIFNFYYFIAVISLLSCTSNSKKAAIAREEVFSSNSVVTENSDVQNVLTQDTKNKNALRIVSWNIKDLGKTKNTQEIHQIAEILRDYDIVALQEVVAKDIGGAQAVANIADELNRMGTKWDYRISDPTKSASAYKSERYAFLWKTSKVNLKKPTYLDSELEEVCSREPFIGEFQVDKNDPTFYLINFHSRKFNERPEEEIIHFKNYPKRLNSERLIILGDFNLDENHVVWDDFYIMGFNSALKNQKTTLKMKCKKGDYLNHVIDNLYFMPTGVQFIKSGSIDYVGNCKNLENARNLSDHLPVFMEFTLN